MQPPPRLLLALLFSVGLSAAISAPTPSAPVRVAQAATATLDKAITALKTSFPAAPTVTIPPFQRPGVSTVNKSRLIDPQNNPQMRDIYTKYQRAALTFQARTLAQNIKAMRSDLARDIPFQQNLVKTSRPESDSTRDQYFVSQANLDWLQNQVTPWLEQAAALLPAGKG